MATGVLVDSGSHTSFALLGSYLDRGDRPILGQAFEDSPHKVWHHKIRVPPWFANLLPEGDLRTFLATSLNVAEARDAPLFAAIGSDLPGAVTIEVADDSLDLEADILDASPVAHDNDPTGIKFSVAGFQLKLSMVHDGSKGWTLAGRGELGNSIVKLPSPAFPWVPQNEYHMMRWAKSLGLDVPDVSLVPLDQLDLPDGLPRFGEPLAFAVRRFDRSGPGYRRIHIEDINQVVGNWPHEKYRNASYESLGRLIFAITGSHDDLLEYVRRLVFIIGIGNEDAHLKNWSLVYSDPRHPRLSPAYDLVSTVGYHGLTRGLGLNLGRSKDFGSVSMHSIRRLARKLAVDETPLVAAVNEIVMRIRDTSATALGDLPDHGASVLAHMSEVPLFTEANR